MNMAAGNTGGPRWDQGVDITVLDRWRDHFLRRLYEMVLRRKRTGVDVLGEPAWPGWGDRHPRWRDELRRLSLLDRQIAAWIALWIRLVRFHARRKPKRTASE